jgi:hypothetical protein
MWLVFTDVTGERGRDYVGYGPTSVMNPTAEVIAQVPLLTVGMVPASRHWRRRSEARSRAIESALTTCP